MNVARLSINTGAKETLGRVALNNHMRGILSQYGIVVTQGFKAISRRLPALLEDEDNGLQC